MARYRDAVCRICRREGDKLFLKGARCYSNKCAFDKRGYAPGQHGHRMKKLSGYGLQLREKQKVRRSYGIGEHQFKGYFFKAEKMRGVTGENLLTLLERRLDNVINKLSFAESLPAARQLVRHRHFTVNGKIVDIPSYLVRLGDLIAVKENKKETLPIKNACQNASSKQIPGWLEANHETIQGKILRLPARSDITLPIQEQLIVELYSK